MTDHPWIYLSPTECHGSHEGGWKQSLEPATDLPATSLVMDNLPAKVFATHRVGILLMDDLLHPLRLKLDQPAKPAELKPFLSWKLKRYLSYPIDKAEIRFLPLEEEHNYVTFSLPRPWVDGLFQALKTKGVHCGYIGGLFSTLLEKTRLCWNSFSIAFFDQVYLFAEVATSGKLLQFRTRRLPFGHDGSLDVATLVHSDLEAFLRADKTEKKVQVLNFSPDLQSHMAALQRELNQFRKDVVVPQLAGPALDRFITLMGTQ